MEPGERSRRRRQAGPWAAAALLAAVVAGASLPARALAAQAPCGDPARFQGLAPLVQGTGAVRALFATSTVPGDLAASDTLYVRIELAAPPGTDRTLFVDADASRDTGMWTYQSPVSGSGWDRMVDGWDAAYRHDGAPTAWAWAPAGGPAVTSSVNGATVDLCIPTASLADGGAPARVRLAAVSRDEWLPAAFLPGADYPAVEAAPALPPGASSEPARLAIDYAFQPWVVRTCTNPKPASMTCAANVFGNFEHVVLSSGLEQVSHPSHALAAKLIAAIRKSHPGTEVWGYVSFVGSPDFDGDGRRDVVNTVPRIRTLAAAWKAMGATGVFVDEFDRCTPSFQDCPRGPTGSELVLSRARQVSAVAAIHGLGMPVFANAYATPDALGPVGGVASPLGGAAGSRPADMYLLESVTVGGGTWVSGLSLAAAQAKVELARTLAAAAGVRVAAVDTMAGWVPDTARASSEYLEGRARAVAAGSTAYGFTNGGYSAPTDLSKNLAVL